MAKNARCDTTRAQQAVFGWCCDILVTCGGDTRTVSCISKWLGDAVLSETWWQGEMSFCGDHPCVGGNGEGCMPKVGNEISGKFRMLLLPAVGQRLPTVGVLAKTPQAAPAWPRSH